MKEYIESFLETIKSSGKSICTYNAYKIDLREFSSFFNGVSLNNLKYSDLQKYVNHMDKTGKSSATKARKISCIKSFFRYLLKIDAIQNNIAIFLESPKLEKKQPAVISSDQASDLLFHARNDGTNENLWFRDYTIVSVFLYTGIRREELSNILLSDLDLDRDYILIHGKGNKQRKVYVNQSLHDVLNEYIEYHRCKIKKSKNSDYLFPSIKSEKISLASLNNIVNKFMKSAGFKKYGLSVHALRKRFATSVFENTHDIATVSKLLGHSSPTVTTRYISLNENDIRKASDSVNF